MLGLELAETPTSRGAKDRALKKLHQMAPDIALFQKESKRVGGVVYGGRRVSDPDRIALDGATPSRKRSISQEEDSETGDEQEPDVEQLVPSKRQKKNTTAKNPTSRQPTPGPLIRALVTGYVQWKDEAKRSADEAVLRALGIEFLDAAPVGNTQSGIDVIVAPKILRTQKFLSGIAFGPMAASTTWLESMIKQNKRLPPEDFELKDTESEQKFDFNLALTLKRAKKNYAKGGMLRDWLIFCTESVHGGWLAFKEVITANGGSCSVYKGRVTNIARLKSRALRDARHASGEGATKGALHIQDEVESEIDDARGDIFLISNEEDKTSWDKFKKMATSEGYTPKIVSTEWIRRIACTQDPTEWDEDWEFTANA